VICRAELGDGKDNNIAVGYFYSYYWVFCRFKFNVLAFWKSGNTGFLVFNGDVDY